MIPTSHERARDVLVACHGILTGTTSPAWTDALGAFLFRERIAVWLEKKEYFAGPISIFNVFVRNRRFAKGLAAELEMIAGGATRLHFVSHSNGTDICLRAIKLMAKKGIRTETFIATGSVLDPDVRENGVAELILADRLGRAYAYVSAKDLPLRLPLKWPYSDLGRRGWMLDGQPYEAPGVIVTRSYPDAGHSGYFSAENCEATFRQVCADMGLMRPAA